MFKLFVLAAVFAVALAAPAPAPKPSILGYEAPIVSAPLVASAPYVAHAPVVSYAAPVSTYVAPVSSYVAPVSYGSYRYYSPSVYNSYHASPYLYL